ncbi:VOC family protein [Rheinheimera sp.]|uniref:VOC family protein n=1 Tax=Rheinheimera sp. TaxID=1869214 RepID=UPI00307D6E37
MAEISKVRFVLAVANLERSTLYYQQVLGMQLEFEAPGWSFLALGAFRVMLGECTDATPAHQLGDHSWYGYITVDDAAGLYAQYQRTGAEFTQPLADKAWGMLEFGVRTPDGHRLMFGQEL